MDLMSRKATIISVAIIKKALDVDRSTHPSLLVPKCSRNSYMTNRAKIK